MDRHTELANFLKIKRTQLTPEQAGLPTTLRRRTPGLRREEVAQRAAVGLTWYTWLEQGRDITVSPQVLRGVARALQLTPAEEHHLFTLAKLPPPEEIESPAFTATPTMEVVVAGFSTMPAILINQSWDVLAWNPLAQKLCGTFEGKAPAELNMLRIMFTDPESRGRIHDWQQHAQNTIGLFRSLNAKFVETEWYGKLIVSLAADSKEFREWWPKHEVYQTMHTPKRYEHPDPRVGTVDVWPVFMKAREYPNFDLLVYVPADQAAQQSLELLGILP